MGSLLETEIGALRFFQDQQEIGVLPQIAENFLAHLDQQHVAIRKRTRPNLSRI